MFDIVENRFEKDGVIKYSDKNNNRIFLKIEEYGKSVRIKIRPADKSVMIETVCMNFPYLDNDGIHFNISRSMTDESEKNRLLIDEEHDVKTYEMLKDAMQIIERAVVMANDLRALTYKSDNMNEAVLNGISKELNADVEHVTMAHMENILSELNEYEEMKNFVAEYVLLLNSKNPLMHNTQERKCFF